MRVGSPASLSGFRIWRCRELWSRLYSRLGSCVAVALAQAGSYSSDSTPRLRTSMCRRCGPQKKKKKEGQEKPLNDEQDLLRKGEKEYSRKQTNDFKVFKAFSHILCHLTSITTLSDKVYISHHITYSHTVAEEL